MAILFLIAWSAAAFAAGAWAGLKLPDVDQRTDLLLHRSILTHGPLVPLIVYILVRNARRLSVRAFPMFLCLGFVVHLSFDLFPRAWMGYALISLPVYGWLPAVVSIVWMATSALLCAFWASRLVRGMQESPLLIFGVLAIFAYAALNEASWIGPLVAALVCLAVGTAASFLWGSDNRKRERMLPF